MRTAIALAFLFFLPGNFLTFLDGVLVFARDLETYWPLFLGALVGVPLRQFFKRKLPGAETFEHELTHALVALFFFRRITHFTATSREGGYITHQGSFGGLFAGDMIGLAPYFLPTFSFILALIIPLLTREALPPVWVIWGATFSYHLLSNVGEVRRNWGSSPLSKPTLSGSDQTDIGKRGQWYSSVVILSATLAVHGLCFWLLVSGYGGFKSWIVDNWAGSLETWMHLVQPLIDRFS